MFPFSENAVDDRHIRTFSSNVDDGELVWHRDREDREITVIKAGGWSFQREDHLPFSLKNGDVFFVKKAEYHRIIKGAGDLEISIRKLNRSERSLRVEKILEIIRNER